MPVIIIDAYNSTTIVESIRMEVKIRFSREYWREHNLKAVQKVEELKSELETIMEKYFPNEYASDVHSEKEYNYYMNRH